MGEYGGMAQLAPVEELFVGHHFDAEIVVLCVRLLPVADVTL